MVETSGYPMAVKYCADRLGITTDRHALYHRLKRKAKKDKAIGNEGEE
ncbi:MAG: hypothetical protein ABJ327_09085 [Litoreibacter sp.]